MEPFEKVYSRILKSEIYLVFMPPWEQKNMALGELTGDNHGPLARVWIEHFQSLMSLCGWGLIVNHGGISPSLARGKHTQSKCVWQDWRKRHVWSVLESCTGHSANALITHLTPEQSTFPFHSYLCMVLGSWMN